MAAGDGKNSFLDFISDSLNTASGMYTTMQAEDRSKDLAKLERDKLRMQQRNSESLRKTLIPLAIGLAVLLVVMMIFRSTKSA